LRPFQDITDPTLAKALAHPLRTRILAALEDRTASPSELAAEFGTPLGVTSYHVRRLKALGFLKLVKRTPRRGAVEHHYKANARPRVTNDAWGATPAVVKHATVAAAVEQVGHYVAEAVAAGGFDQPEAHLTRSPITVDEQGWHELATALETLHERIRAIETDSHARLAHEQHQTEQNATVVLMLFNSPTPDTPIASVARASIPTLPDATSRVKQPGGWSVAANGR
jgi:DNA-binding transcriptional ArsR family regulator